MVPAVRPPLLLVDDDLALLSVLARRFSREGFDARTASSGAAALTALERGWPALAVVDLMMPAMDGIELARRIKRLADLPIIVLTAVDADDSKVATLSEFAEDYVTKPFSFEELLARVQRVLRRTGTARAQVDIDHGELTIDLVGRQVATPRGTYPLTPTEGRLLQVLIGAIDRTVSVEALIERVWPDSDGADPSYVWVTVRRLRRKLEMDPDHPRYLLTDRGAGYRLVSSLAAGTPA